MSRTDCICNRSLVIIASYVDSKLGRHQGLFDGLPYPSDRYDSPEKFFLNEDEWTTLENFRTVFRRAEAMVGERYFYFNCGASTAYLHSWGRLDHFSVLFASPDEGFKRLPFFNKNFNDTKEIEIIKPPSFDPAVGKSRTLLKMTYHDDMDANEDYLGEKYTRGMISSIPVLWGLAPAVIVQPLKPYDPVILFNSDPEFAPFDLDCKMDGDFLTIADGDKCNRRRVGRKVILLPEIVNRESVYLGKYIDPSSLPENPEGGREAVLITETVQRDHTIFFRAGEILKAPYFILDITYGRLSWWGRMVRLLHLGRDRYLSERALVQTINCLREINEERSEAYRTLEKTNEALRETQEQLEVYNRNLEAIVLQRTEELRKARDELIELNGHLEERIQTQVEEIRRYSELRRYLSPKLADQIISLGNSLGSLPQRKMMTVLFSDIRDFSALTDSLEPEEIFHLMDLYLSEMTEVIHQFDGTLNKIVGDGLLVFFGDPISIDDHAQRTVLMAVEMQKRVAILNESWIQYGQDLKIGIGINTGYMTVGNIGSDTHKDYTVIGNQVNVAARLASIAGPGEILVSQRTYSRVRDLVEVEARGEIRVKGIHGTITVYNVKCRI